MAFVHLHNHSDHSLLDGLAKIDELVAKAKEYGCPALALTDHGAMYGSLEFYKKCKKADINPIIGVEAYVANRSRFDKEPRIDAKRYHLTLLAQNATGYHNLIKLVSRANLEGFYYKPRIDRELLAEHGEGIICLSGCLGGELSQALMRGDEGEAERIVKAYRELFPNRYYIEVMHHPAIPEQPRVREALIALAHKHQLPLVATHDVHYVNRDDARAHQTLIAIQTNAGVDDAATFANAQENFSFIPEEEFRNAFRDVPEAVENTLAIAERVNIELPLGEWHFPKVPIPAGSSHPAELTRLAEEGLTRYREKHPKQSAEAQKRMRYELDIIIKKGYAPYFLAVAHILHAAHKMQVLTNTRGSAAGSFVSYLIGITTVDPLAYELPFERFLNPDRPSPPDIDMDFADTGRDRVLDYVRQSYGEDHMAQIGTFGSMMARGSVRDVARALGHPYATGDEIARLIPFGSQGFPMTIDKAMEEEPELRALYERDSAAREIIDLAQRLEGGVRHISVHAAGVVIAPTPITDFVPVQLDPKGGKIITQYDMHSVEDAGLLKFDFLGIRNLSFLGESVTLVEHTQGIRVDLANIPLDDEKTFAMLARGETAAVFQLSGAGMTRWLKELRPSSIHDINAMVALYRPGPMESIPEYIRRKHDPSLVSYLDPRLEKILARSYGVLTYQDDVLLIAIHLAGYSWTEADKLRKAMGKKIPEEMAAQKEKLLNGFIEHGLSQALAKKLWLLIEPFAAYGFNKAHAASYGHVAYQTAYMKAHYPAEYMTAVLTAESGDVETIASMIEECKRMGIPVLPPDVNESYSNFTVIKGTPDTIRFGLESIKNLGVDIAAAIVAERKVRGPYTSVASFLERITHKNLNRKSLEALIKAGALDGLGSNRVTLLGNLDTLVDYARNAHNDAHQSSLFATLSDASVPQLRLKESAPVSTEELLAWEKELLGLYVSGHPLDPYRKELDPVSGTHTIVHALSQNTGASVIVAGLVESARVISTKNGERMAFIKLADFSGTVEAVAFPRVYGGNRELFEPASCIAARGRVGERNGERSIIIEAVKKLEVSNEKAPNAPERVGS